MFRLLFTIITLFFFCQSGFANEKKVIAINKFVSHPALDAASLGIKEALEERGILPDQAELRVSNAQGNITTSAQIAKHLASLTPAFMVGIATPAAQVNLKARTNNEITLAFAAVTDPTAAGMDTAKNIIGVSDQPPIEELMIIALQVLPNIKTVGVIFNAGEINSVKTISILEDILKKKNIALRKSVLNSSSEAKSAVRNLVDKVDIIYLPQDNTVISAIDSILQETTKFNLPVIANDPSLVDKGLLLALGCDYLNSGRQLGFMIADQMQGIAVVPNIQSAKIKELKLNDAVAHKLNIAFPETVRLQSLKEVKS